jgi:hypothetical protein
MTHPLVAQLRFTRSELVRSLEGVTEEEALRRFNPINSIGWIVGHLADQEQRYWLGFRAHDVIVPGLNELVGHGKPASTPPLSEMWEAWRTITAATDPILDSLTEADLQELPAGVGRTMSETFGTLLLRVTYHYWFHIGEGQAIRQLLGHSKLPTFVGDLGGKTPYA